MHTCARDFQANTGESNHKQSCKSLFCKTSLEHVYSQNSIRFYMTREGLKVNENSRFFYFVFLLSSKMINLYETYIASEIKEQTFLYLSNFE
jgi:hypothetical protein